MQRREASPKRWRAARPPEPPDSGLDRLFTDAVVVGAVTALGFAFAHLYEMGYCRHFGIPVYLVSPSTSAIAIALLSIVGMVIFFDDIFGLSSFLLKRLSLPRAAIRVQLTIWAVLIFAAVADYEPLYFAAIVAVVVAINQDAIFALIFNEGSFVQRLKQEEESKSPTRFLGLLSLAMERVGPRFTVVVAFSLFGGLTSAAVGAGLARMQTDFHTLRGQPDTVVVRIYGDQVVAIKFDPVTRQATGETKVFKLEGPLDLRLEKIGPISRPSVKRDTPPSPAPRPSP